MKNIFLALTFFLGVISIQAQESKVVKIQYGQKFNINNFDVEFLKVVSDSRCPNGVDCIRAGEAKVLVNIYKNDDLLETKELVFNASGVINEKTMTLFKSENILIQGLRLMPYPEVHHRIPKHMYCLEIQVI